MPLRRPASRRLCAAELASLGIAGKAEQGGVAWTGTLESVARANLWLRTASRVIVRVAEFRATAFFELEQHARQIPWQSFVSPDSAVSFRVTCRKSRLYHSDAVGERLADAVMRRVAGVAGGRDDQRRRRRRSRRDDGRSTVHRALPA